MVKNKKISFPELIEMLLDEDTPLNPRYLFRLADLTNREFAKFEQAWPNITVWRRKALLEDLEELAESDYVLVFGHIGKLALNDPDPGVRARAIRLLWEEEDPDLVPIYLGLLANDEDEEVRAEAASALGTFVYLGELEELPEAAFLRVEDRLLSTVNGSDTDRVRRMALEALGFSGREEVVLLIKSAFSSKDKDWQISALFAMGRSSNPMWNRQVLRMLDHPNAEIRSEAARAAGELEIEGATSRLLELLRDDDEEVRMAAIWSLSQIGGEGVREALEALEEITDDDDEADLIADALDNLSFTEDLGLFSMVDFAEDVEIGGDGQGEVSEELFDGTEEENEDEE
jgi:HEAT repeat protein